MAVSVSNVEFLNRVCHITNKIYREMLCATTHEGTTYITMGGLDQVSASSWSSQYRNVLSWDLLAWISVEGTIPCSFANFITARSLSGPFYIDPDIYRSQILDYYVENLDR